MNIVIMLKDGRKFEQNNLPERTKRLQTVKVTSTETVEWEYVRTDEVVNDRVVFREV